MPCRATGRCGTRFAVQLPAVEAAATAGPPRAAASGGDIPPPAAESVIVDMPTRAPFVERASEEKSAPASAWNM